MNIDSEEKEEIRQLYEDGQSYKEIAVKYGVSKGRIYQIVKKYKMKS